MKLFCVLGKIRKDGCLITNDTRLFFISNYNMYPENVYGLYLIGHLAFSSYICYKSISLEEY